MLGCQLEWQYIALAAPVWILSEVTEVHAQAVQEKIKLKLAERVASLE